MRCRDLMVVFIVLVATVECFANKRVNLQKCDVLPVPQNVITVPEYTCERDKSAEIEGNEKSQYKAQNDGTPFFDGKTSQLSTENGASYLEGQELYVGPEPFFTKTKEIITEEKEEILLAE